MSGRGSYKKGRTGGSKRGASRRQGRAESLYKKKSLGQHFLREENDARRIAELVIPPEDAKTVLEVGPGQGALTVHLLRGDFELWVSELDDRLIEELPQRFPRLQGRILEGDFIRVDLAPLPDQFVLAGNFPYNISTQIVMRMVDERARIPQMVGMFQKEVARRICAGPGSREYGVISVLIQAWYRTEYCFELPPEAFEPPPKVHSAVIRLHRISREQMRDEKLFRRVVKEAFSQRRKKLRNALKNVVPEAWLDESLFDLRAEALSVQDYEALTERLLDHANQDSRDTDPS